MYKNWQENWMKVTYDSHHGLQSQTMQSRQNRVFSNLTSGIRPKSTSCIFPPRAETILQNPQMAQNAIWVLSIYQRTEKSNFLHASIRSVAKIIKNRITKISYNTVVTFKIQSGFAVSVAIIKYLSAVSDLKLKADYSHYNCIIDFFEKVKRL